MRRWLTTIALGGVTALALTACGNPAGVDGDLTNNWAALGEAKIFVPAADTCHAEEGDGSLRSYKPIDCGQSHKTETLYIGTFTGSATSRESPPSNDSDEMRTARQECHTKVTEAVGGDWRGARLSLSVVLPSEQAWTGGARWFRCDISEVESLDDDDVVARTSSVKGALSSTSELAHTCFTPKLAGSALDSMTPVACTAKHRSEFVGIYTAPDGTFDAMKANSTQTHRQCLSVVASYAKVPNDGDLKYRAGTIYYYPSRSDWEAGERGIKCFVWVSSRDLTGSVKDAGTKGLPINYK
ncbi:hypothetical protein GCM10027290_12430 [Micromonospora sonneratiae]|uniref:Septum formation family protein n=1 Tax=Micromonospora sonneratiae TaxID=1184706 RepID=A0ABW3YGA2_9ACTN